MLPGGCTGCGPNGSADGPPHPLTPISGARSVIGALGEFGSAGAAFGACVHWIATADCPRSPRLRRRRSEDIPTCRHTNRRQKPNHVSGFHLPRDRHHDCVNEPSGLNTVSRATEALQRRTTWLRQRSQRHSQRRRGRQLPRMLDRRRPALALKRPAECKRRRFAAKIRMATDI